MVVDGAPVRLFVTEPTVIVVIGIILSVVAVALLVAAGVVVVLGLRIFSNVAGIRRHLFHA